MTCVRADIIIYCYIERSGEVRVKKKVTNWRRVYLYFPPLFLWLGGGGIFFYFFSSRTALYERFLPSYYISYYYCCVFILSPPTKYNIIVYIYIIWNATTIIGRYGGGVSGAASSYRPDSLIRTVFRLSEIKRENNARMGHSKDIVAGKKTLKLRVWATNVWVKN